MATLEDQVNLTGEGWFRRRVRMASLTAAVAVQGESPENMSPAKYAKRQDLAHRVISTGGQGTPGDDLLRMFTWACANATNADTWIETKDVPDGDIQFTVNSVWDDCAGVTGND